MENSRRGFFPGPVAGTALFVCCRLRLCVRVHESVESPLAAARCSIRQPTTPVSFSRSCPTCENDVCAESLVAGPCLPTCRLCMETRTTIQVMSCSSAPTVSQRAALCRCTWLYPINMKVALGAAAVSLRLHCVSPYCSVAVPGDPEWCEQVFCSRAATLSFHATFVVQAQWLLSLHVVALLLFFGECCNCCYAC